MTAAAGPPQPGSVDVVVVAAGASRRMSGRDKLAAAIGDRPLLAWTLERLDAAAEVGRIVVVTSVERLPGMRGAAWLPATVVDVVAGGSRRQESVAAGVERLAREAGGAAADRLILVHDGARPLVSTELVGAVARATGQHGAAIPVLALAETVKRIAGEDVVETVDRADLATAQTPQGVRRDLLERAWTDFPAAGPRTFTDEASLLEACRIPVHAVPGDPVNIKVTVPEDLDRAAAALLGQGARVAGQPGRRPLIRVGFGSDEHPFGPGRSLALAGVTIAGSPSLHGHSDGDVALHAIADALLGACGLGDLGRLFPAGPETPRGLASGSMLSTVLDRVRAAGFEPTSLDLTIVAGRPRLAEHLEAMRLAVAGLVGLAPERVNVKASSGNLEGWQGAGRGISATAVAVVEARP